MKKTTIILIIMVSQLVSAQIEEDTDTLEIWTFFSIGNFVNQNAERIVEKKWPFKIKGVAGDVFEKELEDTVEVHNICIWAYLDANGYSNSKKEFEIDLHAEINRIKKAVEISNENQTFIELFEKLRKSNHQNYTELNKISDEKYVFLIYSYDVNDLNQGQTFELKYMVDLSNEKIEIIK